MENKLFIITDSVTKIRKHFISTIVRDLLQKLPGC